MGRAVSDARQADIFGAPDPVETPPRPARRRRAEPPPDSAPEPMDQAPAMPSVAPAEVSADALAARLTPSELEELAAGLPDDNLAHLLMASVRQLRRRLSRAARQGSGKGRPSPLERAQRQLATELARDAED